MRWFWFDRYLEFVVGQRATALKNISLAEPHLHDHFPGYPVMPASLIVEGMAQVGGILVSATYKFEELVVLGKIPQTSMSFLPRAGDTLTYKAEVVQLRDSGAFVSTTSYVGDRPQATAEIFYARIDAQDVDQQQRLFAGSQLLHWLRLVNVFEVGQQEDGTPLTVEMFPALLDD